MKNEFTEGNEVNEDPMRNRTQLDTGAMKYSFAPLRSAGRGFGRAIFSDIRSEEREMRASCFAKYVINSGAYLQLRPATSLFQIFVPFVSFCKNPALCPPL